jgi:hypothetical protein
MRAALKLSLLGAGALAYGAVGITTGACVATGVWENSTHCIDDDARRWRLRVAAVSLGTVVVVAWPLTLTALWAIAENNRFAEGINTQVKQ